MPLYAIGAAVTFLSGLYLSKGVIDEAGQAIDSTAELTKQAARAGLVAGGVYMVYLANKKGWI